MATINLEVTGQKTVQVDTIQPDIIRKEYELEEGSYEKDFHLTAIVPAGKKWKVVLKAITTDITEEE